MKKIKWIIPVLLIALVAVLWFSGVIPKQIAKTAGTNYVNEHFPKMELKCTGVEYANVFGDYLISFEDKDGSTYSCVIGPQLFPISLGQGLFAIEQYYAEYYQVDPNLLGEVYSDYNGVSIEIEHLGTNDGIASLDLKWQNDTPYDVTYGNWYTIEREKDGEWHSCASADVNFTEIAYILKPGTMHKTYTYGKYFDTSDAGRYRIRSECYVQTQNGESEHCIVWAEFIVE